MTAGQVHDSTEADHLLLYAKGDAVIADSAYDADRLIDAVKEREMKPVIAMNPTRKYNRRRRDRKLSKLRGHIERLFHRLKRFRALATRYEKSSVNFLAVVHIACAMVWLT